MTPAGLPKTLWKFAAKLADYSDERGSQNGIWVYYAPGWKSSSDPVGNQHQDHEDTVAELVSCVRSVLPCGCDDCKREAGKADLSAVPYDALLAEIRRRKPRTPALSCDCGTCRKCRNRKAQEARRERLRARGVAR